MAFHVWHPFSALEQLRREVEGAFGPHGGWREPFHRHVFPLAGLGRRAFPLINVSEDTDNIYVEAQAPGLDPESIDITILRNELRIEGEKKALRETDETAYYRNERVGGRFVRTTTLPAEIEADKVSARYKDGLLFLTLPKTTAAKPKQIAVSVD